jgi:hypothetical protein
MPTKTKKTKQSPVPQPSPDLDSAKEQAFAQYQSIVEMVAALNLAKIQYQDWFTPWTDYRLTSEQEEIVLTYARCFYFGE